MASLSCLVERHQKNSGGIYGMLQPTYLSLACGTVLARNQWRNTYWLALSFNSRTNSTYRKLSKYRELDIKPCQIYILILSRVVSHANRPNLFSKIRVGSKALQ